MQISFQYAIKSPLKIQNAVKMTGKGEPCKEEK